MDVEVKQKNVLSNSSASGSVTIELHPLVIMNISEHWTRIRAQTGSAQQVIGALIGKQNGRMLEIMNSFELVFTEKNSSIIIDKEYYRTKEEQFKQVFTSLEFLGWYATGGDPTAVDIEAHQQICEITESPIFMKLNPNTFSNDLPIQVYESVIDVNGGLTNTRFVELPYTLATEEAERIGVDHVARMSNVESSGSSSLAAEHLQSQHNSVSMLQTRISFLLRYVKEVRAGTIEYNHEIMREVHAMCHRLPVIDSDKLGNELHDQYNDVALLTYLGVISKGCHTINQFISKFNTLYDRPGVWKRVRGLLL